MPIRKDQGWEFFGLEFSRVRCVVQGWWLAFGR
jgi:hypothetical protein